MDKAIDLTEFKTLQITLSSTLYYVGNYGFTIGFAPNTEVKSFIGLSKYANYKTSLSTQTVSLDVSELTGEHYLYLGLYITYPSGNSGYASSKVNITKLKLVN